MQNQNKIISITDKTKGNSEFMELPFQQMKDAVLGEDYELSLVFCGNALIKRLNRERRKKDIATDTLSFALEKNSGEIFINPSFAKKRAALFGRNFKNFIAYLFIHSLLHLKGMEHSDIMERQENKFRKVFGI